MMRPTQTRHIPRTILTLTAASLAGAAAGAGEPIHTDGAGIDAVETNENVTRSSRARCIPARVSRMQPSG